MPLFQVSVGSELGNLDRVVFEEKSAIFPFPCDDTTVCTYYTVSLPPGVFLLEAWGSQGGNDSYYPDTVFGGRGGYSSGILSISSASEIHIYVGGSGTGEKLTNYGSSGGGGSTDFRFVSGQWNSSSSLNSRILVAGGGGGRHGKNYEKSAYIGNDGGGSSAPTFIANDITITGATSDSGGSSPRADRVIGSFGFASPNTKSNSYSLGGFNGGSRGSDQYSNGGAGGGWYGGCTSWPTGSGGSGYVLNSTTAPSQYPVSSQFYLSSGFTVSGQTSFLDPYCNPEVGHHGNGAAKITLISSNSNHHFHSLTGITCFSPRIFTTFFLFFIQLFFSS